MCRLTRCEQPASREGLCATHWWVVNVAEPTVPMPWTALARTDVSDGQARAEFARRQQERREVAS
jgi:hypothetical protein